jgi:3',5'-cyclic AMP phosphodiesterase CpdA
VSYDIGNKSPLSFYAKVSRNELEALNIRQILVVSDLHISEGYSPENFYWNRRENFTADAAFADFLQAKSAAVRQSHSRLWLIINGDFIDFLRIIDTPKPKDDGEDDLEQWGQVLAHITREKLPRQRRRVLTAFGEFAERWRYYIFGRQPRGLWPSDIRDEFTYGLKTHDFKSIYRLMLAQRGHRAIFRALAQWLADGHFVTIIPGNHDPEFDQELVQAGLLWMLENEAQRAQRLRRPVEYMLADSFEFGNSELSAHDENEAEHDFAWDAPMPVWKIDTQAGAFTPAPDFSKRLKFEKHGLEIDSKIRLEHGHRFEWITSTNEQQFDPERHPHQEIFLAPGSLFNRYLVNHIEMQIPYLDNVKPSTLVINFLMKHHPLRFLKLLGKVLTAGFRHSAQTRRAAFGLGRRLARGAIPHSTRLMSCGCC